MAEINRRLKKIKVSYAAKKKQWVGDGFYVHPQLRPTEELNPIISPFILMDYASPFEFSKTTERRGVGVHPHRGFETVTLTYQGEVEHRDSSGGGGVITPGDVQWMTAGRGIVHDEFHSIEFSKTGGLFEMVQLWVNLPKKYKMTEPKYQSISKNEIPNTKIGNHTDLRVIAGTYGSIKGPASTFSPMNLYDLNGKSADALSLKFSETSNTLILIMDGEMFCEENIFQKQSIVIFEKEGEWVDFKTSSHFKAMVLNGEPIDEPLVAHGPFVMNTRKEISEAIKDYQNGTMGEL